MSTILLNEKRVNQALVDMLKKQLHDAERGIISNCVIVTNGEGQTQRGFSIPEYEDLSMMIGETFKFLWQMSSYGSNMDEKVHQLNSLDSISGGGVFRGGI